MLTFYYFLHIFFIMSWVLDAGLEILAFPCNQFGEQEPGSNDQITDFVCTRFKSEFPIFDKVDLRIVVCCM
jgi:glutathione peroxidase-family protein